MTRFRFARALATSAVILSLSHGPTWAGSLTDTLITTYQQSPVLEGARAALREVDEGVAIARSALRPNIDLNTNGNVNFDDEIGRDNGDDLDSQFTWSASLTASLLLYDNGQSKAAIEAAKARVAAQRDVLRNAEQGVLLDAVAAHMDVRRNIQAVQVAQNNVSVLRQEVQATRDRFELGEVTRTDVSLAEARLAAANANFSAAQGQLTQSREIYEAVVGVPPTNLTAPPNLPPLPGSVAEAEAVAIQRHPSLQAARFLQTAADFDLTRARAAQGLQITGNSNLTVRNVERPGALFAAEQLRRTNEWSFGAGVQGNVPLYRGGALSSAVRQAQAGLDQAKFDVQDIARQIRQNAAIAWSNLLVARATIVANREEVRAARIAFEGVREEARLGARTTLDVLDLEQQLRDAEVQLATSLRDEYVAAYQVLSAMGLLSVEHLRLGIPTYDPDVNYNRVQNAPYSTVEGTILDKLRDRYGR